MRTGIGPSPQANASGSYSRCTNCAVNAMNRMRACNCIVGSLVPVTWNEVRKSARLPTAARFSKVRNFRYAVPVSRRPPPAICWYTWQYSVV
jgi:hypothetical protein